jgi:AcrR family transcriptional regulator
MNSEQPLGYPSRVVSLPEHLASGPVGQRKLSRELIEEQQRGQVLDAAIEVFAKRGYPATTVDHIVSGAKIGVGTFYSLFEGKEDCFLQAYDRVLAVGRDNVAAAVPTGAEWPEQACSVLRTVLELVAAEPLRARLILVEAQTAGEAALSRYEETIDLLVPELRRGRKFSSIADELPMTLEVATLGGLLWYLQQRVVLGDLEGLERHLPEVAEIVLKPYLGAEETDRLVQAAGGANATL